MNQRSHGAGVGTVSLITIFAVLCLTVFAMLTLSASNAEKLLADKTASFVKGYYEADYLAAVVQANIVDSGEFPESVYGVDVSYEKEGAATVASYSCRVSDAQDLRVKLKLDAGQAAVLEWKTVYALGWEADDAITVWDGESFE
ncbi:MAG: hypothetical protein FWG42_01100 [Clostridiales bacterium]|nr:hypothetical protein [Clostridiales bacterium]